MPNMLMIGMETYSPLEATLAAEFPDDVEDVSTDFVISLRDRFQETREQVRERLNVTARRQKLSYDRNVAKKGFQVGDFVWLRDERQRKGYAPKLQMMFEGPYLVVSRISDVVYRIQETPRSKPKVVHYKKWKRYTGKPLDSWLEKVKLLPLDQRQQIGKPGESVDVETKGGGHDALSLQLKPLWK
ncbi:uncharacterized protein [Ptychodera flava]|uniref:uncharacterized protein n=1 Tax=Ptychodera flava TaxID=63121 RepID=UPI003969E73C